jgi:hypothetical protein
MKLIGLFFISILFSYSLFAQSEKLGAEISLVEKTNISDILAQPEEYLGKKVLVEGEITNVCESMGCWMELKSEDGQTMRIKVKDGDIVFPTEAKGRKALAEGEVYKIEMDEETAKEFYAHMAEESGQSFDESTITGPVTIYQIKGLGAIIDMPAAAATEVTE